MFSRFTFKGRNSPPPYEAVDLSPPPPYKAVDPASVTGNQSDRIGNVHSSRRPVSPALSLTQDSRIVKFTMFKGGIKIEGSGLSSDGIVVPQQSKQTIKLTGRKTVMVGPSKDRQFVGVLATGYLNFGLYFDRGNDVVTLQPELASAVELHDGVPHAVSREINVERRADVVTVRFF